MVYRYTPQNTTKYRRRAKQKQVIKWLVLALLVEAAIGVWMVVTSEVKIDTQVDIRLSFAPAVAYAKELSVEEQIEARIHEVFGDRGNDAIKMLKTCENKSFDPKEVSPLNSNGTVDVGIFQVNADPKNTEEVEKLKDWEYNIQRAYKKFEAKKRTFYYWTCGHVVGDYTYVDYLRGK